MKPTLEEKRKELREEIAAREEALAAMQRVRDLTLEMPEAGPNPYFHGILKMLTVQAAMQMVAIEGRKARLEASYEVTNR